MGKTHVTGYALSKIVNILLAEESEEGAEPLKPVDPQMIYRYMQTGAIKTEAFGEGDKVQHLIPNAEAAKWAKTYVANRIARQTVETNFDASAWLDENLVADVPEVPKAPVQDKKSA